MFPLFLFTDAVHSLLLIRLSRHTPTQLQKQTGQVAKDVVEVDDENVLDAKNVNNEEEIKTLCCGQVLGIRTRGRRRLDIELRLEENKLACEIFHQLPKSGLYICKQKK